jgi:hypothetical protein
MRFFRLTLVTLVFTSLYNLAHGQEFIKDNQGRVISVQKYTDIQGTPFLVDTWTKAIVRLKSNGNFSNISVKYDLVEDQLLFRDVKSDQPMEFIDQVLEFKLIADDESWSIFKKGFKASDGNTSNNFYQVLYDGGTQLLKRKVKKVIEDRPYSSAVTVKTFQEIETYYLAKANEPLKIKKDKKQILTVLADHAAELEKYIQENKLNVKEDEDLIKLIAYYNTL